MNIEEWQILLMLISMNLNSKIECFNISIESYKENN